MPAKRASPGPSRIVLLGAGASTEAGVPLARKLASDLYRAVKTTGDLEARAMRVVMAGLHARRSTVYEDPFGEIDVEDLYEGLLLLAMRKNHPLAPFVSAWHPSVAEADLPDFEEAAGQVSKALADLLTSSLEAMETRIGSSGVGSRHDPTGVGILEAAPFLRTMQQALELTAGRPGRRNVFRSAADKMIKQLIPWVWVQDPRMVAYIKPLVLAASRQKNMRVATLNYDNTIELACSQSGVSIDDGVRDGKRAIAFRNHAQVQLAKLHGSLNWHINPTGEVFRSGTTPEFDSPGLIFGGGNKLRVEGPFLDLLMAFRRWLEESAEVLVVGYSFRDRHVNHLLIEWLSDDDAHKIVIVDPTLDRATVRANIDAAWAGDQRISPDAVASRFTIESLPASAGFKKYFPS